MEGPIQIDIDSVLRSRLPRHYRYIPRWLVRRVAKTICQEELNEMLRANYPRRDADFCAGVIDHLNVSYQSHGIEHLDPSQPRVIIASNHPLGGLDGLILIDLVTRHYGIKPKFVVNDLLMAVEPLSGVFVPINKHGRQSRRASSTLEEAMTSDAPVIIFPAGLVSRAAKSGGIADLTWQKNFINQAIRHHRPIIPTYFSGRNSKFFYTFAKWRKRLGMKFNIEMVRLPREIFLCRGKAYDIYFGEPIPWQDLDGGSRAAQTAATIRNTVYSLKK